MAGRSQVINRQVYRVVLPPAVYARYAPAMPDTGLLLLICVVLMLGSALQSAAGFAFGMFAIPLLMLLGLPSPQAIAVISICGAVQTIYAVWVHREAAHWRLVAAATLVGGACIAPGVWALHGLVAMVEPEVTRQIFGGIVLLALLLHWLARVTPRERLPRFWFWIVFPLSGFMSGLSGMGGPPVVLWVMSHLWDSVRSRVFLWAYFLCLTPFSQVFLWRRFGGEIIDASVLAALLSPVMLFGILPGLWLGKRIAKPTLRRISYIILLLVSLYAIAQPLLPSAATAAVHPIEFNW
jgi:uncharacterized membrane protein YfcA